MYLEKLNPNRDDLWQRPKKVISDPFKEWYDNVPVGKDKLNAAMKRISQKAQLSQIYKNHSIRATVMETLDEGGFEARHIMAQSGHKSESSIKTYARRCPTKKKREMNYCLHNKLNNEENQIAIPEKRSKASTVSTPTSNPQILNAIEAPQPQPLQAAEAPVLPENFQLVPQQSDEIPDDILIKALEEIEKENAPVMQQNLPPATPQPNAVVPQAINVQNVANYANIQQMQRQLPAMYFPNSTVTINYNFNK